MIIVTGVTGSGKSSLGARARAVLGDTYGVLNFGIIMGNKAREAGIADSIEALRASDMDTYRRVMLDACDEVQLCAQALCLEEQFGVEIERAALYYARTRHREEVVLHGPLRRQTEQAVWDVRQLLSSGRTPPAVREPKCSSCSLQDLCLPSAGGSSVRDYLEHLFDSTEDP